MTDNCAFCQLLGSGDARWVAREPAALAFLAQRVAQAQTRALGATGVNVLNASGPHSGQSVAHLHFHVVPRWPEDAPDDWLWSEARSTRPTGGDEHLRMAADLRPLP